MELIGVTHATYLPHIFFGAFFILIVYLLFVWRRNHKLRLYNRKNVGRIYSTFRLVCYGFLLSLLGLGIGLLLLKPYIKVAEPHTIYDPLHIVIANDISLSVLAQATGDPCGPSRFDVARKELNEFVKLIEERSSDFVGLVVFARFGYRVVPVLTRDYQLFKRILYGVEEDEIKFGILQGTNHWDAVLEAAKIFEPNTNKKQLLIIITDGEPDGPPEVLAERRQQALTALSELRGVSVYIIGIGDPVYAYPIPKERHKNGCPAEFYVQEEGEDEGQIIFTRPDANELTLLARELGGVYKHSKTGSDLASLLNNVLSKERIAVGVRHEYFYKDLTRYIVCFLLTVMILIVVLKSP